MLPIPLQPSYPKRPVRHHHGVLTPGFLAIGDGTATDTIGFLASTRLIRVPRYIMTLGFFGQEPMIAAHSFLTR